MVSYFRFLGPFVREGVSPSPSPLLHRAMPNVRAVTKTGDIVDGPNVQASTPPTSPQLGKLIIRAARSPDRAASPDYVRTPATVVGPTNPTSPHRQFRGAYVNVQGDEGKTSSTDEHRDCTGRTDRLETPRTAIIPASSRVNDECTRRQSGSPTLALAPSNKPDGAIDKGVSQGASQVDRQTKRKPDHDENYSPAHNGDAHQSNVRAIAPSKVNHPVALNCTNSRLDFEKLGLYAKTLKATGNTPKSGRKLLVSDLDTPNFCRKRSDHDSQNKIEENTTVNNLETSDKNVTIDSAELDNQNAKKKSDPTRSGDRVDRKVKRSESYRMANSPIMFIKKFSASSQAEKSSKICRTPSEELQEELLRERINYPETVSSPEPQINSNVIFETKLTTSPVSIQSLPVSPRPRASDLEPARVLKYSGNDTEIW